MPVFNIMFSVPRILFSSSATLLVLGISFSFRTYVLYKKLEKEWEESIVKYERSNCVVMYAHGYICGWPPNKNRVKCSMGKINILFEPVIYFIDMTEKTLDIAVMMINVEKYLEALGRAKQRGVKIRIVTQFDRDSRSLMKLRKIADSLVLFVPYEASFAKLLHYKYMIRDFQTTNECVCMGSMNFTLTGATDNFENLVFTQISCIIENVEENFNRILEMLNEDNKQLYQRTVLQTIGMSI